ncbi:MAG: hypothetical protein U5N58_07005 [Actinomycetota bacterium]|nr:hypothetical protein [Actinomycetota bacterium]
MKRLIIIIIAISMAIFLFTGCSCAAENLTERMIERAAATEGDNVDVDISGGEVKIKGEDGEEFNISSDDEVTTMTTDEGETKITSGQSLDVPDGFPNEVPLPSDLNIFTSSSTQDGGKQQYAIMSGYEGGTGAELFDWYKSQLSGWEIESEQTFEAEDGGNYNIVANQGSYEVNIFIFESEDGVNLSLQVSEM